MGKPIARSESQETIQPSKIEQMVSATSVMQSNCRICFSPCEMKAMLLDLPNFKDLVLTLTECVICGDKTRGIKTGSEISPKGRKITLRVQNQHALHLELIKSETCSIIIPEIDLELTRGTLGTQLTTVEGLLRMVLDDLKRHVTSITPDEEARRSSETNALGTFLGKLERLADGLDEFTLIIDDPLSNSFIQEENLADLLLEEYERSETLNAELGLTLSA